MLVRRGHVLLSCAAMYRRNQALTDHGLSARSLPKASVSIARFNGPRVIRGSRQESRISATRSTPMAIRIVGSARLRLLKAELFHQRRPGPSRASTSFIAFVTGDVSRFKTATRRVQKRWSWPKKQDNCAPPALGRSPRSSSRTLSLKSPGQIRFHPAGNGALHKLAHPSPLVIWQQVEIQRPLCCD